jgi:diaminopimelate decarboxylase
VNAHPAGPRHAEEFHHSGVPPCPSTAQELLELAPNVWPRNAVRGEDGIVSIAGVSLQSLAQEYGTPLFVIDEDDFRSRCREIAAAFGGGANVHYAGKAFLSSEIARWIDEEGLSLDVCTGGELAVALHADFPPERIAFHGNNKSVTELTAAVKAGIAHVVVDSMIEIERLDAIAGEAGIVQDVLVRVTVGVEAHTHEFISTAHEDQKFGLSLSGGAAARAVQRILARPELDFRGLHSHIGSQIFDTDGFEVAARRLLGLHAQVRREHGVTLPEMDLGGGFGVAYTSEHDPLAPKTLADGLAEIVRRECRALGAEVPRISVEPGRAIAGPSTFTLYRVGTVKDVELEHGTGRRYIAVDGGMSDNIRTALYDADYSCTVASRASSAAPVLARVVGKHCESGDVVVKDEFLPSDLAAGDLLAVPGTGAYCRSMASQYNHVPRPPVIAVRDRATRVLVRRETEDDLLALDAG